MADMVLRDILREVKAAKFFSLVVDVTTDIVHQEQVSFVFHYVDSECTCSIEKLCLLQMECTVSNSLENFFPNTLNLMLDSLKNRFSCASCDVLRGFAAPHSSKLSVSDISGVAMLTNFYMNGIDQVSHLVEY